MIRHRIKNWGVLAMLLFSGFSSFTNAGPDKISDRFPFSYQIHRPVCVVNIFLTFWFDSKRT